MFNTASYPVFAILLTLSITTFRKSKDNTKPYKFKSTKTGDILIQKYQVEQSTQLYKTETESTVLATTTTPKTTTENVVTGCAFRNSLTLILAE